MQSVQVVEVAPRDGLQNVRAILPTEDLLYLLHRSGVQTGMSLPALEPATSLLAGALGTEVPGLLTKAGPFPA